MPSKTKRLIKRKLVQPLAAALMEPPARFLILSRGRTGSNLLASLLNSHPAVRVRGEVVGEAVLRDPDQKAEVLAEGPREYVERCLDRTLFESTVGVKILYYQLERDYEETWGVPGLTDVREFLRSQPDIKVIHLKRLNRLETLASIRVAAITKEYDSRSRSSSANHIRISLAPGDCEEEFDRIGRWERDYDEFFEDHEIFGACYETLVAKWQEEFDRILDFLGVPRRILRTSMRKQRIRHLSEIIENYEELKTRFSGTEWSAFFED
jgi:LPS sulfotransferase NodH